MIKNLDDSRHFRIRFSVNVYFFWANKWATANDTSSSKLNKQNINRCISMSPLISCDESLFKSIYFNERDHSIVGAYQHILCIGLRTGGSGWCSTANGMQNRLFKNLSPGNFQIVQKIWSLINIFSHRTTTLMFFNLQKICIIFYAFL